MTEQLKEMGMRLAALREIREFSCKELAEKIGVSEAEYTAYERGENDFSFSFMSNVAEILEVDVSSLLAGQSPKLANCAVVKKGRGYHIKRNNAYDYMHLAYTFMNKRAEPFLVTVSPGKEDGGKNAHEGQEFNYIISGKIKFSIGEYDYELEKGDSVYFDSSLPHCMKALGDKPAKFIAVVIK